MWEISTTVWWVGRDDWLYLFTADSPRQGVQNSSHMVPRQSPISELLRVRPLNFSRCTTVFHLPSRPGNSRMDGRNPVKYNLKKYIKKSMLNRMKTYPGSGPPFVSSKTWWGFNSFLKLYNKSRPLRPPLFGFTNTSRGQLFCGSLVD